MLNFKRKRIVPSKIHIRQFPVKITPGFTKFTYAFLKNENEINMRVKSER